MFARKKVNDRPSAFVLGVIQQSPTDYCPFCFFVVFSIHTTQCWKIVFFFNFIFVYLMERRKRERNVSTHRNDYGFDIFWWIKPSVRFATNNDLIFNLKKKLYRPKNWKRQREIKKKTVIAGNFHAPIGNIPKKKLFYGFILLLNGLSRTLARIRTNTVITVWNMNAGMRKIGCEFNDR